MTNNRALKLRLEIDQFLAELNRGHKRRVQLKKEILETALAENYEAIPGLVAELNEMRERGEWIYKAVANRRAIIREEVSKAN